MREPGPYSCAMKKETIAQSKAPPPRARPNELRPQAFASFPGHNVLNKSWPVSATMVGIDNRCFAGVLPDHVPDGFLRCPSLQSFPFLFTRPKQLGGGDALAA